MTGLPQRERSEVPAPDHETAIKPLSIEQTQAVLRLLIDTYYGDKQPDYSSADLAWFHADLDEALNPQEAE